MYKVVGKGNYTKEALLEMLSSFGIANPLSVVKEATEKRRVICGDLRILVFN
ncbi:hypothetical protein [Paenibacillus sp. FSL H7-0331]|uniref:hypothetical protein n=1 Tax=Paenibacillus sp. FSL H7-0331 TaxID=1920421 RepID=UPI0015C33F04|nr:hypothetical protein [Paenibacillus sp. FSL H7-0331]